MFGLSLPFIVAIVLLVLLRAFLTIYLWHNRRKLKRKVSEILSED